MATADRIEPATSKRPSASSLELGTERTAITADTAIIAIGTANSHRQLR